MAHSAATITLTLHWQGKSGPRAANIICEDSPPAELIPILANGCGLPERDAQGAAPGYLLRLGLAGGPILNPERALGAQGVSDGSHLWLGLPRGAGAGPRQCGLVLPEGGAVIVPPSGLTLTRRWLMRALELLQPDAYAGELRLLEAGRSDYRFVSKQPHCAISPASPGDWQLTTERDDVLTLHNGAPLPPRRPARLADGDALQLGAGGPILTISMV